MPCASAVPGASAMLAVGKPRPVPRLAPPRHHARHAPPPAQHLGRALDVALAQLGADGARGEHLAGFRNLADDGHAEAQRVCQPAAGFRGRRRGPCRSGNRSRPRPGARRAPRRARGRRSRPPTARRGPHRRAARPRHRARTCSSSRSFRGSGVRRKCGLSGWKYSRGCGSNTTAPAGAPSLPASSCVALMQRLVAAMHAIEVADGERRAARGSRDVVRAVDDAHGARHRPLHRGAVKRFAVDTGSGSR